MVSGKKFDTLKIADEAITIKDNEYSWNGSNAAPIINIQTKSNVSIESITIGYTDNTPSVDPTQCAKPTAMVGDTELTQNGTFYVNDVLTLTSKDNGNILYSLVNQVAADNFVDYYKEPIALKEGLWHLKAKATDPDGKLTDSELLSIEFDVKKREAGISFSKATATAYLDAISEFTAPDLLNPNNLVGISYTSSNPEIATVVADGTVAPLAVGETTITAAFAGNDEYEAGEAKYVLTVEAVKPLMEEIVINEFFDDVTSQTYTQYSKESDFADYITIVSLSGSNCNWNTGNSNLGKNSGLIVKSQKGYYPVKITVESNYSNNNTFNVYASDSELTLSTLKDCKEISALSTDNRTYNFTRDFAYIGLRPSVDKSVTINKITIVYAPRPEAPVFAEGHGIDENGVLSTSDNSKDLFFVPMENAEIYYRLTAKPAANVLAEEATDEIHGDFKKLEDHTQAINVTKDHASLEYYSYVNGVKSNVNKVTLDLGNSATGVAEIEAAGAGEVRWFDMQGREVKGQPEKGIYVRVVNGRASKVIL